MPLLPAALIAGGVVAVVTAIVGLTLDALGSDALPAWWMLLAVPAGAALAHRLHSRRRA